MNHGATNCPTHQRLQRFKDGTSARILKIRIALFLGHNPR